MAQELADEDPRHLGAFEIIGRLGEGGQGIVYLGRSGTGQPVAIKLLHARLSADTEARARFLREVSVAQRVARFCTAAVLHADLAGNQPYIVSEYVPGPSLRQLVEREGPRQGAALDRLAVSTATALTAIHRAGILHRDMKPANVLMGPEGPVVIDFGIARALDTPGATATGDTLGTPSYLAPEQLAGTSPTPAVDLFAWGVTMVFAATGRPAFGSDSIPAVMNRILNEQPDLAALDDPLRDLVAASLSKDPAQRPSADEVVAHLMGRPAVTAGPLSIGPLLAGGQGTLSTPEEQQTRSTGQAGGRGAGGRRRGRGRSGRPIALPIVAGVTAAVLAGGAVVLLRATTSSGVTASPVATASPPMATALPVAAEKRPSGPAPSLPTPSAQGTASKAASPTPEATASPGRADPKPAQPPARQAPRPASDPTTRPAPGDEPTKGPAKDPATRPPKDKDPATRTTKGPAPSAEPPAPPAPAPLSTPTTKPTTAPNPPTKPITPPKPNPYTATGLCGAGYKVIDSHSFGGGTTYLLRNASAGKNCVVTLSMYVRPKKVRLGVVLQVKGGATKAYSGAYPAYAGPVRLAAKTACVTWGGGYGASAWKSGWSHCG